MTNAVTNIEKMLQDVEVKQMMAIYQTKNLEDAAAMFTRLNIGKITIRCGISSRTIQRKNIRRASI